MFDIDQDVEILALIQAAYNILYIHNLTDQVLKQKLHYVLHKVEEEYGKEIFTYTGV